jgi:hypothetical protein
VNVCFFTALPFVQQGIALHDLELPIGVIADLGLVGCDAMSWLSFFRAFEEFGDSVFVSQGGTNPITRHHIRENSEDFSLRALLCVSFPGLTHFFW